ncbi:MAG: hypothetical protein J6M60_06290 [Clostridia bacterium]|nr:hypothetical protein [Clostridia bacterium]
MKIIGIDEEEEVKKKVLNHKKIVITIAVVLITLTLIIFYCIYLGNRDFREFTDKYLFMKNVTENNLVSIALEEGEDNYVYAYDKYVSILSQNRLVGYNKLGNKEYELKVEVSNPISDSNGRFLIIGEKEGKKVYLVSGNNIVWENQLEGNISRVSVNKNGYVSVILTGTTYKSIIQTFDNNGKELFKTYLSSSLAMDSDISSDNKYLSFAEVSTNGTLVQTIVKTISIQKAQEKPSESIIHAVSVPSDKVPLNLKYQDSNKLICMFNDSVELIKDDEHQEIMNLTENGKKITYGGAELNNSIFRVVEKNTFLSSETTIEIQNTGSGQVSLYILDGTAKEVYSHDNTIALNLGTEVHFVGSNGWLLKKYTSNQDVKKIVINNDFAGVIYKNKIEIVDL